MRDCHSIVGLYTYQNRVPFAPSLRWVSCKERDRLPHEGANFHSSFVHYRKIERAKRPRHVPVVFTREEVSCVLAHLNSMPHLRASLLYGAGVRLMECVRLRVKDVDVASHQITGQDGKGAHARAPCCLRL